MDNLRTNVIALDISLSRLSFVLVQGGSGGFFDNLSKPEILLIANSLISKTSVCQGQWMTKFTVDDYL